MFAPAIMGFLLASFLFVFAIYQGAQMSGDPLSAWTLVTMASLPVWIAVLCLVNTLEESLSERLLNAMRVDRNKAFRLFHAESQSGRNLSGRIETMLSRVPARGYALAYLAGGSAIATVMLHHGVPLPSGVITPAVWECIWWGLIGPGFSP